MAKSARHSSGTWGSSRGTSSARSVACTFRDSTSFTKFGPVHTSAFLARE
ncbi:hypothetical protein OWM54_28145 [Myxococcus sp. MISCRS1]|nr:hypothetical protein [Myxococcus sp. MISCRS1]MCY1001030.1 hypothetical protein [Myxococcus sp. MISCRS1]